MRLQSGKRLFALPFLAAAGLLIIPARRPQAVSAKAQTNASDQLFLPLTQGTYWAYRGTARWTDSATNKAVATHTSIKTQIERVIEKPEFTIAIVSGYPGSLDWSNGQAQTEYSILIETHNHEVFINTVPPDFDYTSWKDRRYLLTSFFHRTTYCSAVH